MLRGWHGVALGHGAESFGMESLEIPFILFFVRWIEDGVLLLDVRPFYAIISVLFYVIYSLRDFRKIY